MKKNRISKVILLSAALDFCASIAGAEECLFRGGLSIGEHLLSASEKFLNGNKKEACEELRIESEGIAARRAKLKELPSKCVSKEEVKNLDVTEKSAREMSSSFECKF